MGFLPQFLFLISCSTKMPSIFLLLLYKYSCLHFPTNTFPHPTLLHLTPSILLPLLLSLGPLYMFLDDPSPSEYWLGIPLFCQIHLWGWIVFGGVYRVFHGHYHDNCTQWQYYFCLCNSDAFNFFCLITVPRTSNTMLNRSGESRYPCLVPELSGKSLKISSLRNGVRRSGQLHANIWNSTTNLHHTIK